MGKTIRVKKIDATGKETIYDSIRQAAERNHTHYKNISRCINGVYKTCLGYRWERVEDKEDDK